VTWLFHTRHTSLYATWLFYTWYDSFIPDTPHSYVTPLIHTRKWYRQCSFADTQGSFTDTQGSFADTQGSFAYTQGSFADMQSSSSFIHDTPHSYVTPLIYMRHHSSICDTTHPYVTRIIHSHYHSLLTMPREHLLLILPDRIHSLQTDSIIALILHSLLSITRDHCFFNNAG